MANTDYIIIVDPKLQYISATNPEKALKKFKLKKKIVGKTDILVCPRNASKLNGNYIPPKKDAERKE